MLLDASGGAYGVRRLFSCQRLLFYSVQVISASATFNTAHNLTGVDVCDASGLVSIGIRADDTYPTRLGIGVLSGGMIRDCVWIAVDVARAQASTSRRSGYLKKCMRRTRTNPSVFRRGEGGEEMSRRMRERECGGEVAIQSLTSNGSDSGVQQVQL
ncbi:hypothetical protein BDN67DRAFT_967609 [Paxillus ammoniavirescens]|nr:hypothetical protein BDN67DRAFT_967609 [Paxillus ammoniavirescens]